MTEENIQNEPDLTHISPGLRHLAVPVDSLSEDPSNARVHSTRNIDVIMGSLRKFGQVKPIVTDETRRGRAAATRRCPTRGIRSGP